MLRGWIPEHRCSCGWQGASLGTKIHLPWMLSYLLACGVLIYALDFRIPWWGIGAMLIFAYVPPMVARRLHRCPACGSRDLTESV